MSSNNLSRKELKLLWGVGSRCSICRTPLIEKEENGTCKYLVGVMAHIEGENPGSARYNENMTDKDRNGLENRILLCPTCHTKIDNDPDFYTVEKLKQIKKDHIKWQEETIERHLPQITFVELEVITKYLENASICDGDSITVVPPKEKIERNKLSGDVENLITRGMLQVKQVKDYLNKHPDIQFSDRLRAGFVHKYRALKEEGLEGDSLFYELFKFASNNLVEFKMKAAGLSVLTYFFELCEVFEQ